MRLGTVRKSHGVGSRSDVEFVLGLHDERVQKLGDFFIETVLVEGWVMICSEEVAQRVEGGSEQVVQGHLAPSVVARYDRDIVR